MVEFNIRQFYKDTVAKQEKDLSESTGLEIRHDFQSFLSGSKEEDVFIVKTSDRECYGMEFNKAIFYFRPIDKSKMLIFILDESLIETIALLAHIPEERLSVLRKYIPSIMRGLTNTNNGDFDEPCLFVEEDKVGIAKHITYSLIEKLKEGYWAEPELIYEVLGLINFRNLCVKELTSFPGFSQRDENEILLKKGFNLLKKGLKMYRMSDMFSS